jgi:hypothetical protein
VPGADAPGADEIPVTEIDLTALQPRNPFLVTATKLVEQAPDDVHLKGAQDHDTALADNSGGIEMADGAKGDNGVREPLRRTVMPQTGPSGKASGLLHTETALTTALFLVDSRGPDSLSRVPVRAECPPMDRYQLLAAEIYGYSYANYEDHLGIGNVRFDKLMPDVARTLECADTEGWSVDEVARALDVDADAAAKFLRAFRCARDVVDAENAAESFRCGVRQSIESAATKGLRDEASIERLVTQICFRAADLAFLLEQEGKSLSRYSQHLRREPGVQYVEGDFEE